MAIPRVPVLLFFVQGEEGEPLGGVPERVEVARVPVVGEHIQLTDDPRDEHGLVAVRGVTLVALTDDTDIAAIVFVEDLHDDDDDDDESA
jgi:hypothetical protein